jgi:hypothetical protein
MPTQYGLYAAIAAASVGAIAVARVESKLNLDRRLGAMKDEFNVLLKTKPRKESGDGELIRTKDALRAEIETGVRKIQTSLDASVSALDLHCADNHAAAEAALRAEYRETFSELEDILTNELGEIESRAVTESVKTVRGYMLQQAAASRDEASCAGDDAMQRVKLLEARLDAMQKENHAANPPIIISPQEIKALCDRSDLLEEERKEDAAKAKAAKAAAAEKAAKAAATAKAAEADDID